MGFQSLKTDDVMSFKEANQELVGHFVGTQTGQGQNGNSCVHALKRDDGSVVKFWGSKIIDEEIAKLRVGDYTKVVYLGLQQPKNSGGRPYHNFDVLVDYDKFDGVSGVNDANDPAMPEANDEFPGADF